MTTQKKGPGGRKIVKAVKRMISKHKVRKAERKRKRKGPSCGTGSNYKWKCKTKSKA